jgi:hypothetical protein
MALTLTTSGSLNTTVDNYAFSILSNTSSVQLGAVSLKLVVPGGCTIKNVNAGTSSVDSLVFLQQDGNLTIGMYTLSNWVVNTNDVILSITASGMSTGSFTLNTDEDWYCEIASSSAEPFTDFAIKIPSLASPYASVSTTLEAVSILSGVNPSITSIGAPNSSVFGSGSRTLGTASIAEGINTLASGLASHAAGINTTASGQAAFSIGIETDADGIASFAAGSGSWARGDSSVAMGIGTIASASAQVTIGHYNFPLNSPDHLFVVGGGTGASPSSRGNLLEVYGGIGSTYKAVKIDVGSTFTQTSAPPQGFSIYGNTTFNGNVTGSNFNAIGVDTKTVQDPILGIITTGSFTSNFYRSQVAPGGGPVVFENVLKASAGFDHRGINFSLSEQTTAPGSTFLWTNSSNRLFYSSSAVILNDGNTLGTTMTIGTTDTNNLQLETNNTTRVFISSSGNVGIGTTTPSVSLQVSDSTQFGNSLDDTHTFTGSINTTGSLSLKGPLYDNLGTAGTPDQILFTTSTGVEWRDNFAENVIITGKNVGVSTIQKGTPLYFTSSGTSGNIVGILPADASNPNRMPAGGVAGEQITAGSEGNIYLSGYISNLDTSAFNSGDNVYVAVGGGYTNIKPTGSAFIQKIGNVEKVNASNGSTVIQGPNWFNDLPNWEIGRVMVGRSNGQPVTSSLVYLDESNSRLGLGTTSPLSTLTVAGGNININSGFAIGGNNLGSFSPFIRYSNTGAGVPSSSFGHTTAYMLSDAGGVFGTNDLSFYAGAITQPEIMRIVGSTGFVGIGESSPSAKLEIKGSGATSATTALRVENSNASASLTILNDGTSAFNTSHLYVSSSGRVGIGTTLPTASLHISGASNSNLLQVQSPAQTNIFVISGSGNVGIGTGTPSARLHINGDTILSGSLYTYGANTDIDSGSFRTIITVATSSYRAAFFDYVLTSGSNARAGTVFSVWQGTSVEYADTSTNDIGNTSGVNLLVSMSGANIGLFASSSNDNWSMKALARLL